MKKILSIDGADIYDSVLPESLLEQLWLFINFLPYSRTDLEEWTKVWSIADGIILRGPQWLGTFPDWDLKPPRLPRHLKPLPKNPEPLVELFKIVHDLCLSDENLSILKRISITPYVWPPKTSLSWHADGGQSDPSRLGAFTFYIHKNWNAEWGGELLISNYQGQVIRTPFDNTIISEKIIDSGFGTWISPKQNRLVLNSSNVYHKVSKTTEGAGIRLSIQGFIYSK